MLTVPVRLSRPVKSRIQTDHFFSKQRESTLGLNWFSFFLLRKDLTHLSVWRSFFGQFWISHSQEKYAHRRNAIYRNHKSSFNIVKTRPSCVNCGNINVIAMGPTHAWSVQRCHHREFMILVCNKIKNIVCPWCVFAKCISINHITFSKVSFWHILQKKIRSE